MTLYSPITKKCFTILSFSEHTVEKTTIKSTVMCGSLALHGEDYKQGRAILTIVNILVLRPAKKKACYRLASHLRVAIHILVPYLSTSKRCRISHLLPTRLQLRQIQPISKLFEGSTAALVENWRPFASFV